jgi:Terminase large subunit, T4likevirus-type, N-terminal
MITASERKILENEYIKCYNDIAYMAKTYCKVNTLTEGMVPFKLYPFQETCLSLLAKHDKVIILKSRQMGVSSICSLEALRHLLFTDNYKAIVFANKQKTAIEIIDKVKSLYNSLPTFIKGKDEPIVNNKLELKLPNGSIIRAYSSNSDEGRSQAANLILVDEAAFCDNMEVLYGAIYPSISTGGRIVILSTPNSQSGFFYNHWLNAESGKNGFLPIKLDWRLHPKRDEAWRKRQSDELGEKLAKQEYDAVFAGTGEGFFDTKDIEYFEKNTVTKPLYTSGEFHEFWFWSTPDYQKNYMVLLDVGRGDGNDNSTVQIIDLSNFEQVGEYEGQLDPKSLAIKGKAVAVEWNNAILVVEVNGMGEATALDLEQLGYDNLYKTHKGSDIHTSNQFINTYSYDDNLKTGFSMTTKTRPMVISKLQDAVVKKSIIIRSSRTVSEMKSFIWLNSKPQASRGSHDDLLMPLAISCYLREYALMFASKSVAMSKQLVSNISVYRNKEYNNFAQIGHNENIIRQYDLQDYDIWN